MSFLVSFFSDKIITIHHNTTYKGFLSHGHHSANTHHFGAVHPRPVPPPSLIYTLLVTPQLSLQLHSTLLPLFQLYFHFSLGQHLFTELFLVWLDLASPPTLPTKFSWTISLSQSPDFCQISRISTGICFRLGLILPTRQTLSENIIFFCFRFRWTDKPPFRVINLRFLLQVLLTWNSWSRDHIKGQ